MSWPALQLSVEIELEVGSSASLLRALNRLQTYCSSYQALHDALIAESAANGRAVWRKPWTWLGRWMQGGDTKVCLQPLHAPRVSPFTGMQHAVKTPHASAPVLEKAGGSVLLQGAAY